MPPWWISRVVWFMVASGFAPAGAIAATQPGNVVVVHAFHHVPQDADGARPQGLTLAQDGALYGVTVDGGLFGGGTIFRVDAHDGFSTLYSFRGPEGLHPTDCLVAAADGFLYGTTSLGFVIGGADYAPSSLFRIDRKGTFTRVYVFPRDPAIRITVVVRGIDGNMYGESPDPQPGFTGVGATFQLVGQRLGTINWPDFRISPPGMYLSAGWDSLEQFRITREHTGGAIPPDIGDWKLPAPGETRSFQRRAMCGLSTATSDGHTLTGASRSISRNPAFGWYSLVPSYVRIGRNNPTPNPNHARLGQPVGPPAEGPNGIVYLASVRIPETSGINQQRAGILSIDTAGQVAVVAWLDEIGWPVFGLTPSSTGYFYGLAGGNVARPAAIYRFKPGGPVETVYTFPATQRGFAGPLIETRDGVFYGTLDRLAGVDEGQIFRLEIASHRP